MSDHEYYRELGALAAIGQVSEEEDHAWREHCLECPDCRDAFGEYASILNNHLPNLNPARFRLKNEFIHPSSQQEIRERFLARARHEGAEFSEEVEHQTRKGSKSFQNLKWTPLIWGGAWVALLFIAIYAVRLFRTTNQMPTAEMATVTRQNEALRNALERVRRKYDTTTTTEESISASKKDIEKQYQGRITTIEKQLAESTGRAKVLESRLTDLQSQNAGLNSQKQDSQQLIHDLQAQLVQEKSNEAGTLAALVDSQDKVHSLTASLRESSQRLTMEQQLASVTSDVRQLMGARNLHIIDVHDVNPFGKTAKSFGRVFYAENKSLVFYAFDLPSSKTSTNYYFQAWGQAEANEHSVRNLGVFRIDDHEQRRWILKVSAPALLKGIDSVFVTAETKGDVVLPRGKRVLYAYLLGQANHP